MEVIRGLTLKRALVGQWGVQQGVVIGADLLFVGGIGNRTERGGVAVIRRVIGNGRCFCHMHLCWIQAQRARALILGGTQNHGDRGRRRKESASICRGHPGTDEITGRCLGETDRLRQARDEPPPTLRDSNL